MSKKKSFTTAAINTITGGTTKKATAEPAKKAAQTPAPTKKVAEIKDKAAKKPAAAVSFTSRNTKRTGKPVTLYLNTENYKRFKEKAAGEDKTASTLMNEFMVTYLNR